MGDKHEGEKLIKKLTYYFKKFSKDSGRPLLRKVAKGDQVAFRGLVDRYHDELYDYTFQFVKSQKVAEDMVQETFSKVWLHRQAIDHSSPSASYYLFNIISGLIFSYLRQVANDHGLRKELWRHLQIAVNQAEDLMIHVGSDESADQAIAKLALQRQLVYKLSVP